MERIAVVGGGQAGASAVAALRSGGFDGALTLHCAEPVPPYQRPPLSKKYLLGEMARERLYLRPDAFYAEAEIDLRLGSAVSALDPDARTLTADRGPERYDALILATGAVPRRLPAAPAGVHTIRTLADIDALAPAMVPGARVAIIGGGYIGLEAAAVAATIGLEVTLIEAAPRILGRVASVETADWFRALHRAHGVDLREGVAISGIEGGDRVIGVRLEGGETIAADLVLVGIGVDPDTALAESAGLALDNGIAVDALGRTSAPGIWAAGDCASFPWRGGRLRLESVQNAIDMAEAVAANVLGAEGPYMPQPWFWSDQYDVKLQIAGLGLGHDRIVVRDGDRPGSRSHWYYAGPTLLAIDAMNDPRAYMTAKRLIEAGRSPDPGTLATADLRGLLG